MSSVSISLLNIIYHCCIGSPTMSFYKCKCLSVPQQQLHTPFPFIACHVLYTWLFQLLRRRASHTVRSLCLRDVGVETLCLNFLTNTLRIQCLPISATIMTPPIHCQTRKSRWTCSNFVITAISITKNTRGCF